MCHTKNLRLPRLHPVCNSVCVYVCVCGEGRVDFVAQKSNKYHKRKAEDHHKALNHWIIYHLLLVNLNIGLKSFVTSQFTHLFFIAVFFINSTYLCPDFNVLI